VRIVFLVLERDRDTT